MIDVHGRCQLRTNDAPLQIRHEEKVRLQDFETKKWFVPFVPRRPSDATSEPALKSRSKFNYADASIRQLCQMNQERQGLFFNTFRVNYLLMK